MKVLISGAGPAGLTAAYWLKRYGFTPTIVERAPHLLVGGYKIDVRGAALHVINRMGIHDAVVAARTDMQGAQLVDKQGKVIERMSGDEFGHRVTGDLEIVRGTLCEILRGHLGDVELLFGDTIQGINQSSNNTQVQFTKNGVREFDCVIGADGLHSNVRRIALGEESRFLRDLGLYLCVYSVPNYLKLDRMEMQYSELGRIAAIWSSRGDANAKACFGFAAPTLQIGLHDRSQQQQALKTVYEGIGWEVPRLMELMPTASNWYFDKAAQINMPRWSQGRVVLVGDAAYCASAHVRARHESRTHRRLCARRRTGRHIRRLSARICRIRELDASLCRSQSSAGTQILKDNVVRKKQVGQRLAPEAVYADNAGTRVRMDYQSLHRTDQKGGQRNFAERL